MIEDLILMNSVKEPKKLGLRLKKSQALAEFNEMDANGGGVVLFDEFCVWFTKKIDPTREIATTTHNLF